MSWVELEIGLGLGLGSGMGRPYRPQTITVSATRIVGLFMRAR